MKHLMRRTNLVLLILTFVTLFASGVYAETTYYPTAIFPFEERGASVKGYGEKAADIMFAMLVAQPELFLVERSELEKILTEQELNISGIVSPTEAVKIGQLTGAKILITGSVFEVEKKLYIVAKIIGTETSRVLGESVTGRPAEFAANVEALAEKVGSKISEEAQKLVAAIPSKEDRIDAINEALGESERPVMFVRIKEQHIGPQAIDPAAQTEIIKILRETGFEVIDSEEGSSKNADLLIEGEGFSEFAMRKGNLVSVKARLELKVVDLKTDKIVVSDRYTSVVVDLSEQIAGKKGLQEAAAALAERVLPKIVEK